MLCQPSFKGVQNASLTTQELVFSIENRLFRYNLQSQATLQKDFAFPIDQFVCIKDSVLISSDKIYIERNGRDEPLECVCQQYDPKEVQNIFSSDGKLFVIQEGEIIRLDADTRIENVFKSENLGSVISVSGFDDYTLVQSQSGYALYKKNDQIAIPDCSGYQEVFLIKEHLVLVSSREVLKIGIQSREVVGKVVFDAPIASPSKFGNLLAAGVGDDIVLFDLDKFKAVFMVKRQDKLFEAYQIPSEQTIQYVRLQNEHILVVQGPICFIINKSDEPEITSHFLLTPSEWEDFGIVGQNFCFGVGGRGLFFGSCLNIFNGKGFENPLLADGNYIIEQSKIYQTQGNRILHIRTFDAPITGIIKLQDSSLALLMDQTLYHLDETGKVLQYFKTDAIQVGRYQNMVWLRRIDRIEFYNAKDFKLKKKLTFSKPIDQAIAHQSQIYFIIRQNTFLQLFTFQNNDWFECGSVELEYGNDVQIDLFGLFIFESDLRNIVVKRFMDMKIVKRLQISGALRVADDIFINTEKGIVRIQIPEVDSVRNDCRRQFVQDVSEFWSSVEWIKWK